MSNNYREKQSYDGMASACSSDEGLLLRELTHRINNEFAAIISTISLAAARSPHRQVRVALNRAIEVLHNYAAVHRYLRAPKPGMRVDAAEYLGDLCGAMTRSRLERMGIELELVAARVTLPSDQAWRLGLIVYELVTNAARHGLRGSAGIIRVDLSCTDNLVYCKVTDNGSPSPHTGRGQGLTIIGHLARDIGGTIDRHFGADGSRSILIFPFATTATRAIEDPISNGSLHSRKYMPHSALRDLRQTAI
jgi:two-component sensor histidine kinase